MAWKIDPATGERMIDPMTGEPVEESAGPAGGIGGGREVEGAFGERDPQAEGPGIVDRLKSAVLAPADLAAKVGPPALKFAGNVAQSLTTGPINAVAQAVQDKDGAAPVAWQAAKNVVKSTLNPFVPGENPIQSTEKTLERAGVPNEPRVADNMVPGFVMKSNARSSAYGLKPEDEDLFENNQMYPIPTKSPGMAKELGFMADIFTPAFGVGAIKGAAKLAGKAADKVIEPVGAALRSVGSDQMNRVIKPLMRHERKAKAPIEDVIFKYKFDMGEKGGAGPKAIFDRSSQKLNELGKKLKGEIKAGRDGGARVNTDDLIDQVVAELKANPGESEDFYTMVKDIDEIASDFKARAQAANGKGDLDLLQAHAFKKYMGHEGAWQQIAQSKGIPLSAKETSRSKIAEDIYHRLNDAIDKGAPNGIRDLNRQISEIIPVNQAAGWRQIVDGRGNKVSLTDVIGMTATAINPKVWPVLALSKATKSGTVASKIYRLGEAMTAANVSPKATKLWATLQKPLDEVQKARIIAALEAEIGAKPSNVIPFDTKKVAGEPEESPRVRKLKRAIEQAKDEESRKRLQALLDEETGTKEDNTRYSRQ